MIAEQPGGSGSSSSILAVEVLSVRLSILDQLGVPVPEQGTQLCIS